MLHGAAALEDLVYAAVPVIILILLRVPVSQDSLVFHWGHLDNLQIFTIFKNVIPVLLFPQFLKVEPRPTDGVFARSPAFDPLEPLLDLRHGPVVPVAIIGFVMLSG